MENWKAGRMEGRIDTTAHLIDMGMLGSGGMGQQVHHVMSDLELVFVCLRLIYSFRRCSLCLASPLLAPPERSIMSH